MTWRRLAAAALVVAGILLVLRGLVVPLARQRVGRRAQEPTLTALIPAAAQHWALRRNFSRALPPVLSAAGQADLRARLLGWGLPLDALAESLGLSRLWGFEWAGGLDGAGGWFLAGPRARLWEERAERVPLAAADTVFAVQGGWLALRGPFFVCASERELLEGGWLAAQPAWSEREDLLLGGDWLEYVRREGGGALIGVKRLQEAVLCEGLAWNCAGGAALLASLAPGPVALEPVAPASLDPAPFLRRNAPFAPDGRPLPPEAQRAARADSAGLRCVQRIWESDAHASLARVLFPE